MLLFLYHLLRRNIIMKKTKKFISIFLLLLTITSVYRFNQNPIISATSFFDSQIDVQGIVEYDDIYF